VNPENPQDAVLERGVTWEALWVLPSSLPTSIGVVILAVCVKVMFEQIRLPASE